MRRIATLAALAVVGSIGACTPRTTEANAVRRGDEAFAQGNYEEALAEYRLAVRQGGDGADIAARVAHTYAQMGRVDDAGSYYMEAVVPADSSLADQAVADLMRLARDAQASQDYFAMATAVQTALRIRPGVGVGDMALPLARHYFRNGEHGRALPFYQNALAADESPPPEIVLEVGQAYEQIGDCEHALVFFERFRGMVRPRERGEVDWYIGTCAFNLARDIQDSEDLEELERGLQLLDRTVEVGEPRNIQAQAWFERGEILSSMGECDAAMEAYAQVRFAYQAGAWVDRAQSRIDQIRFGRDIDLYEGPCR